MGIEYGILTFDYMSPTTPVSPKTWGFWAALPYVPDTTPHWSSRYELAWEFEAAFKPRLLVLSIPLYIPFLLLALPTTYLWLRNRRTKSPNACPACDYDLSGIQTGSPCPECGNCAKR